MVRLHISIVILFSLFVFISGCSDEGVDDSEDHFKTISIADSLGLDSGEARVFLLPAPLQVVSALKDYNLPYSGILIADYKPNYGNSPEYLNALNLGMNTIDLGYAAFYGDYQVGINYSKNVEQLMDGLGIRSAITASMVDRFEKNIDRQDTLSKIILEAYSASHEYFQQNEREGVGLLILTGCFIEGLYLATAIDDVFYNQQLQGLIALHKDYTENILLLLNYYKNSDDVAAIVNEIKSIRDDFKGLSYQYDSKTGKAMLKNPIPKEKLLAIRKAISALRNKIRSQS